MDPQPEAVATLLLFPRVSGHHRQLVDLADRDIVVAISLERMGMTHISVTSGLAVIGAHALDLRVVGVVGTVGMLIVGERVVGIPCQAVNDLQRSLGDILHTLPVGLKGVLMEQRHRIVVL